MFSMSIMCIVKKAMTGCQALGMSWSWIAAKPSRGHREPTTCGAGCSLLSEYSLGIIGGWEEKAGGTSSVPPVTK